MLNKVIFSLPFLKLARVDVGNVSKKGKICKVLLLAVFLLVGYFNQTLSIYECLHWILGEKRLAVKNIFQNIP